MSGGCDKPQTFQLLSESLEALRLADRALLAAAEGLGWIGSGVLTYAVRDDNSMGEGMTPAVDRFPTLNHCREGWLWKCLAGSFLATHQLVFAPS